MKILKTIFKILLGTGIIYLLFIAFFVFKPDINDYLNRTEFNITEWINWEDTEATFGLRWNMTHDLTKNYNLKGKTKEEIKKLLGEPSSESLNEMSYYLGLTGHGINTGSLTLKFDKERVINIKIWQG
jgi:hypothetical protein